MTFRSFLAWFLSVYVPFVAIGFHHREFSNWYVMGAMIAAFYGGMLADSPRVKETVRTVTRHIVTVIEVRR